MKSKVMLMKVKGAALSPNSQLPEASAINTSKTDVCVHYGDGEAGPAGTPAYLCLWIPQEARMLRKQSFGKDFRMTPASQLQ